MSITDWPARERPRAKPLTQGTRALADAKLLAVLLHSSGRAGVDAVALARNPLRRHSSVRTALAAQRHAFLAAPAVGLVAHCRLQAGLELARRHFEEVMHCAPSLKSRQATRDFLVTCLCDSPHELFCCLHLDSHHRLIQFGEGRSR